MKKLLTATLAFVLALGLSGCSLFVKEDVVKLNENYDHKDPKDIDYDKRMVLKKDGFEEDIEFNVNMMAYPDTVIYDQDGNPVGMYEYDETTGLAIGEMNLETGEYTQYAPGQEIDLGKPDESLMIDIPGTVNLYYVIYGNKDEMVASCVYFFLSDASAKEVVKTNVEAMFGIELTEESDTVLKATESKDAIASKFSEAEALGQTLEKKDVDTYASLLTQLYGVREASGKNPYKAYAGHEDPEDLDFDERVVYTASGAEAVYPENAKYMSSMTNYVYAKDGVVIADYTYYESPSKEAADALMEVDEISCLNPVRASDTAILVVTAGQDMEDLVSAYIGYTVMADNSLDEYIKMLEGTYFSMESK